MKISDIVEHIRKARWGRDVREAIASGMECIYGKAREALSRVEEIEHKADSGYFQGEQGEKGEPGTIENATAKDISTSDKSNVQDKLNQIEDYTESACILLGYDKKYILPANDKDMRGMHVYACRNSTYKDNKITVHEDGIFQLQGNLQFENSELKDSVYIEVLIENGGNLSLTRLLSNQISLGVINGVSLQSTLVLKKGAVLTLFIHPLEKEVIVKGGASIDYGISATTISMYKIAGYPTINTTQVNQLPMRLERRN